MTRDTGTGLLRGSIPTHDRRVPNGLIQDLDVQPWMSDSLCAQTDPDAFYPEKGGSTREAKQVCLRCDVREQCLEYALEHEERFGIWGGKSERERRKLNKQRRTQA